MIVESVKCWTLSREELVGCRGYPLGGCDCSQCVSLRRYGIPDMPLEMLREPEQQADGKPG